MSEREMIERDQVRTIGALVVAAGGVIRITKEAAQEAEEYSLTRNTDPETGDTVIRAVKREEPAHV